MKKLLLAILSVAMIFSSTVIASAASLWGNTSWTYNTEVEFYIQRFGIQMDESGSVSSQDTAFFTPLVHEGNLTSGRRSTDYTLVYKEGEVSSDDILEELNRFSRPNEADIFNKVKAEYEETGYIRSASGRIIPWDELTTDNYEIRWYVLKFEGTAAGRDSSWHIDGVIIEKETDLPIEIPTETDPTPVPTVEPTVEPDPTEVPVEPTATPVEPTAEPTEAPVEPTAEPTEEPAPIIPVEYESDYAYIFGYSDTVMGAEGNLQRCEISAMIHRLVKQNGKLGGFVYDEGAVPPFSDIEGEWFRSGIEYMNYKNAFTPDGSGRVYPYVNVTRGEAFRLICIGLGFVDDTDMTIDQYAGILYNAGYIEGDENGDLNVDSLITRAEFCTIYNRIIGRDEMGLEMADGTEVTAETYGFTDLDDGEWYYETMLKATSAYDEDGYVDLELRGIRNDLDDFS